MKWGGKVGKEVGIESTARKLDLKTGIKSGNGNWELGIENGK